jgi:hypothetical protein
MNAHKEKKSVKGSMKVGKGPKEIGKNIPATKAVKGKGTARKLVK